MNTFFFKIARFALLLLCTSHAWADDYADIAQMLRNNQPAKALDRVEKYLAEYPRDPQARFFKAVAQDALGQTNQAITSYTLLMEEYPELPEPYNNLAVIRAAQGDIDRARALLETAVHLNPAYTSAYENLGDIYARLAQQTYGKAMQLDAKSKSIPPKLVMLGSMLSPIKVVPPTPTPVSLSAPPAPTLPATLPPTTVTTPVKP